MSTHSKPLSHTEVCWSFKHMHLSFCFKWTDRSSPEYLSVLSSSHPASPATSKTNSRKKTHMVFLKLSDLIGRIDRKKDKIERKILDSQERAFWDVHRPVVSFCLCMWDYSCSPRLRPQNISFLSSSSSDSSAWTSRQKIQGKKGLKINLQSFSFFTFPAWMCQHNRDGHQEMQTHEEPAQS